MATGRERRAELLNERLRGAQRANVEDESFHIDIAGLNILRSTPGVPAPAPATSSASNASTKGRSRNDETPSTIPERRSAPRRSPRTTAPTNIYDPPDTSKESIAQVTSAIRAIRQDAAPEEESEVMREAEQQPPSPASLSQASPEANSDLIALPTLHAPNASRSPVTRRITRSSLDAVPLSSARIREAVHTDEVPPSSSPLVRKARRSDAASIVRSRNSQRQSSRLAEESDVDVPSLDRPADRDPANEERLSSDAVEEPVEIEVEEDADAEATEEEPVEEAVEEVAEEVGEIEAAKTLRRKRTRQNVASKSPSTEPDEQREDEEEEPNSKRRRGKTVRSPAAEKQPAPKPRNRPQAKQPAEPKPKDKQIQRLKKATKERRISDGTAIEITVQRFVNVKKYGKEAEDEDPLSSEVPFAARGENVVDVFAQVCMEVIDATLVQLYNLATMTDDRDKKKECRIKTRAIEAYKEELTSRLLQHAIHLNDWHSLRKRVRLVQREKLVLRQEVLRLKEEQEQVDLRMDAVRIKHEEDTKESTYRLDTSVLMHDVDLAVERGRDAPELSRAEEKKAEVANLELLVARIASEASSASAAGGILQQVKDFNAFLERAAVALESR